MGFAELVRSRSKGGVEVRVEVPEKEAYDFIWAGYGKAGRWGFDGEDDAVGYGDSIMETRRNRGGYNDTKAWYLRQRR